VTPDIVVDVGNSQIKFGLCEPDGIHVVATLPPDDLGSYASLVKEFGLAPPVRWAVAGVHPERTARFVGWARSRGESVLQIESHSQLSIRIHTDVPDQIGIDRLLAAMAVNHRRPAAKPAVFIDAGSAITVNAIDRDGAFLGGAIMPGFRLMGLALHQFTAKLPFVSAEVMSMTGIPAPPAKNTRDAIACGLVAAAEGGVRFLHARLRERLGEGAFFVTGGDAAILAERLSDLKPEWVTSLTLEGIRIAAEALP
jgi:type III pantothenate kinase